MEPLSRYDQATVSRWARSHHELQAQRQDRWLADAAVHAILARLRPCCTVPALLRAYDQDGADEFSLIGSVLPPYPRPETLWCIREAAFYLRCLELTAGPAQSA